MNMTKTRSYKKIHDELDTLLKRKILVFAELGNKSCKECIEAGANVVIARVSCDANQNWNEMRQLFKDTSAAVQSSSNDKQQEKVFIAAKLNLSNDICEGEFNFDLAANKVTDVLEELDFAVVDLLILDSIQDTRIARAAIFALETFKETEKQVKDIPLVISCLVEENGRLKCGQTVDAFSGMAFVMQIP